MAPKLILSDAAKRELAEAGASKIDSHLEVFGQQRSVFNQDLDLVVKAVLETEGLPHDGAERIDLLQDCAAFARELSLFKLRTYNEGVKELLVKFKVNDVPAEIQWAAARVGVKLLDDPESH